MRARHVLTAVSALFVVFGLSPLERAQAESGAAAVKEQAAAVAEEKAEVAEEEAEIAREAAELEKKKAALAEKKAAAAKKEAKVIKETTARAYQLEQELAELKTKETERGLVYTLEDVLFEYDKADLKAGAMRKLYPLVTFLREQPRRDILIEGHTDSTGSESYNLDLSQRRAAAVRDFLVSNGIDPERVTARGYGKAYPVASNTTEAGREQNRRVEVVILREGERVAKRMR
jgi:outer membrane protein OmpA-like peptidoglycan-associated protein